MSTGTTLNIKNAKQKVVSILLPQVNVNLFSLRHYLEEVVFEEIPHRLVSRDHPPSVVVEVKGSEEQDEYECAELRLVADGYENDEQSSNHVVQNFQEGHLEADQGDEHEGQEDSTRQLHQVLGRVVTQGRYPREQGLALDPGLGQHQHQGAKKCEVAEEEVHVPEDAVRQRLEDDDEEEHSARYADLHPAQDHDAAAQLAHQIHDYKNCA